MKSRIESTHRFDRESRRLVRKYKSLRTELHQLRDQLQQGQRPGARLSGIGYSTFKVRLPNQSARRGKSGGFRVIYYEHADTLVLLLVIYSKTEYADIADATIRQLIEELD